jgi:uncharacterized protein
MPPGARGKYFLARLRGLEVAAVSSIPESAPPKAMWDTYIWVDSADETAARVREAGGRVVKEPFDVMDAGRMAVVTDPEGAVFLHVASEEAQRRARRQRAGLVELQRAPHP